MFKKKGLLLCVIMLILTAFAVPAAFAADSVSVDDALSEIVTYYADNKTALDNWEEVVGLAGAGENISAAPWQLPDWGIASLESSSSVKYATTILGMLAAGQDPANVEGRDLVQELALRQTDSGAFGEYITDTIWAMIAIDEAHGIYDINKAAAYLINQKTSDGGFALSGDTADPDITGFVLMALASHRDIQEVSDAVNAAKLSLQNMQLENGGFASWGTENAETTATVIRGLIACDEDITTEAWKNGKMIDALFAFQLEDKSFSHTIGGNHNDMATRQALIAVADMVNANIDYQIGQSGQSGGGASEEVTVRVRVEGVASSLADEVVTVNGKALDALKAAVGENNVQLDQYGMVGTILGESGQKNVAEGIDTGWMYYVIRNGAIEPAAFNEGPGSFNIVNGDEIVFYIGAYNNATWEAKTYFPVVNVSPDVPSAGQSLTINISARNYNYTTGIENLNPDTSQAIGAYTVKVGETEYTSFFGQVTIHNVPQGLLTYTITNSSDAGYADVVSYKGSIEVGAASESQVRVRVEGVAGNLKDEVVTVKGTAFDALKAAVGENNVQLDQYGMVGTILGETGHRDVADGIDTSWLYYVIRDGAIDSSAFTQGSDSYNIKNGDQIIFYIGAYDNTTWDARTYFPDISFTPTEPVAGQSLVLSIAARKNVWGVLQDLSQDEIASIGDYTVKVGTNDYLSSDGKITISNVSQGTLQFTISNSNPAGYPDVITYTGSIQVKDQSGGGSLVDNGITVSIAVVGKGGNLVYRPGTVQISKNDQFGLTAMSALAATGLSYELSSRNDGMVVSIAGEANERMNGWCGKINTTSFWDVPREIPVSQGDKIIFWYSIDANFNGPKWEDLLAGNTVQITVPGVSKDEIKQTLNSYSEELNKFLKTLNAEEETRNLKTLNASKKMTQAAAKALKEQLDSNKVDINDPAGRTEAFLGNTEVCMQVPENALSETRNLSIKELTSNQGQQANIRVGTSIYEFGPDGTKFDKKITISIKVPITEDLNIEQLTPAWYDEESKQWVPIPAVIDLETGIVLFKIDHFTKFAVIELLQPVKIPEVIIKENRITFSDVNENMAWAKDAIEILAGRGIIKGTGPELFQPQRPITRAEFVQLAITALQLKTEEYKKGMFNDVNESDWFASSVTTAHHNRIVSGYPDGSFKPGRSISRNEIASIFYQMEGVKDIKDVKLTYHDLPDIPAWTLNGVKYMNKQELMSGYENGTFRGQNPLTRAEAAVVIYKYLNMAQRL